MCENGEYACIRICVCVCEREREREREKKYRNNSNKIKKIKLASSLYNNIQLNKQMYVHTYTHIQLLTNHI